jgi:hypothetical protein
MGSLLFWFFFVFAAPAIEINPYLYSPEGTEMQVTFKAHYLTRYKTLGELNEARATDPAVFLKQTIEPTLKYLYGPLTRRGWGGIKKTLRIELLWESATETAAGVLLPYEYSGRWLIATPFLVDSKKILPVPYNLSVLMSKDWKQCTDSHHSEVGFYWYYWDPDRPGCDHQVDREFQNTSVTLTEATEETRLTFPEYQRMIRTQEGKRTFPITIGFGYYEEPEKPHPDTDKDSGIREYQQFLRLLKPLLPSHTVESKIRRSEYPPFYGDDFTIGRRFQFKKNALWYDLRVVTNAGVDQMVLFAKSFARDHEAYFGWLGHSRVGSGFDAIRFSQMLKDFPTLYSLTADYQLIYWGGCNSYSYYTEPFFKLKSGLSPDDPNGTRSLDIIANGLPSFFSLNAANAMLHVRALLSWQETPKSYQDLLAETENLAQSFGTSVLSVVLGDEDNSL